MTVRRQPIPDAPPPGRRAAARRVQDRRRGGDRRAGERRYGDYPCDSRDTRLRFAAQAAGFGTYDLDCASGDSVWSPELRSMAGLPASNEPLSLAQVESLIHPDDRGHFRENFSAALQPAGSGEFEAVLRIPRQDGKLCWARAKGRTFFVGDGPDRRPLAATGIVMDITARREAEMALAESHEELDKMVEAAIDSVITIDTEQRIIRFNPSAARMFGVSPEEVLGSRVERFMPERYRATHAEKVMAFAASEAPATALSAPRRFQGLRANGEEFSFEATITKVNVAGRARMTTFMRDITDRAKAEEDLRRSKQDLELAVRGGNIGIWHWNLRTGKVEWSERTYELFGIPAGTEITHDRVMAALYPDDRETVDAAVRALLERGIEYHVENRIVRADGSTHWVEAIGRAVQEPETGEVVGVRGVAFDVTDRRLAEEALRRSKEDLELAVRGANMGIWTWDSRTGRFELSGRCRQLFGIPPGDALSQERIFSALHPEDQERAREALRKAVEEGAQYQIEKRFVWPDGSIHWVECIGRELFDDKARAVGVRGIALDIGERKAAEEKLRHSKEDLEFRVTERTAELTLANEELLRSNMELQQFAFIAAHDLQTPLRSITGFAQLLQKEYEGRFDSQADAWLEQLVRSSERMYNVVHGILAYSRVESRGGAFQPTDLDQLLDQVLATLEVPIRETGARIIRSHLPTVEGDRIQLAQVLQNLIDNALKYRGDRRPEIQVSAARQGGEWVFSVRDNGIGIAEKHLSHVFEIFKRLHTQQEYPGTGIGLAVCRRVIHRHGGKIWVESRPGEGSTFYFTLPERPEAAE